MTNQNEMTCRELVEVITDYLVGTLPTVDRGRFEEHLRECPYCMNYLEQMRVTVETLGQLREESLSVEARRGLIEAFRGWRGVA